MLNCRIKTSPGNKSTSKVGIVTWNNEILLKQTFSVSTGIVTEQV
jgi:hypothetical protein